MSPQATVILIFIQRSFHMKKQFVLNHRTFADLSKNDDITENGIYTYLCLKPFAVSSKEKERLLLCIIRIFI